VLYMAHVLLVLCRSACLINKSKSHFHSLACCPLNLKSSVTPQIPSLFQHQPSKSLNKCTVWNGLARVIGLWLCLLFEISGQIRFSLFVLVPIQFVSIKACSIYCRLFFMSVSEGYMPWQWLSHWGSDKFNFFFFINFFFKFSINALHVLLLFSDWIS
jgi:hypothetical protein